MEPLEGLLQRKGKAPELVTVYKIQSNWEYPAPPVVCLQSAIWMRYMGADGMMRHHVQMGNGDERIVFNRPHSGRNWKPTSLPSNNYWLLRDIIEGWLPLRDGWTASKDEDATRITGNGKVSVFFMEHETGRAYPDANTSSLDLCDILKPII